MRRFFYVIVRIAEQADLMRPGMSVRVEVIRRRSEDALLVPRGALRAFSGKTEVRLRSGGVQTVDIDFCAELAVRDRRFAPRRNRAAAAGALCPGSAMRQLGVLGTAAALRPLAAGSCETGVRTAGRAVPVEKQDLVLDIVVTGTLLSLDSEHVGPPPTVTSLWRFKIIRIVPEGTQVQAAQEVVVFDPSELEKRLKDLQTYYASDTRDLGRMRAEHALAELKDHQDLEEAEANQRKKALKAEPAAGSDPGARAEAGHHRARPGAEERRLRASALAQPADPGRLGSRRRGGAPEAGPRPHRGRQDRAGAVVRQGAATGTVVYGTNDKDEKYKVGDDVSRGTSVLRDRLALADGGAGTGPTKSTPRSVAVGQHVACASRRTRIRNTPAWSSGSPASCRPSPRSPRSGSCSSTSSCCRPIRC